jgi:thiamine transport system ATP-binding protein
MSKHAAVQLDAVSLKLGTADFHFDHSFSAGRITAIIGPSGSGKSTLLNLIAGFEAPDHGRILMDGQDVTGQHPGERPLSLVFQDNNLFAHLDLFTNVGLGLHPALRLSAEDRQAVSHALDRVGLSGFKTRKPGTLSGGERQRAAFARALVRKRPLLLLDEPFAALDPDLRHAMADLLVELHRESGNTVLLVTHDRAEVERLADEVVRIHDGQFLEAEQQEVVSAQKDLQGISKFVRPS